MDTARLMAWTLHAQVLESMGFTPPLEIKRWQRTFEAWIFQGQALSLRIVQRPSVTGVSSEHSVTLASVRRSGSVALRASRWRMFPSVNLTLLMFRVKNRQRLMPVVYRAV